MSDMNNELINHHECRFVRDMIKSIEFTYKVRVILTDEIIREINKLYPTTSGCEFADWINHRLYSYIATERLMNNENAPRYVDFEDLEEEEDE
jgi:hypothetical protein